MNWRQPILKTNKQNKIIISDSTHSFGGREIWRRLSHKSFVYSYNTETKEYSQIDLENDDFYLEDFSYEIKKFIRI